MPQASTVTFLSEQVGCSTEEIAALAEYADKSILTLNILRHNFKAAPEFIKQFLQYAQAANLTLDAYLTGNVDRPKYGLPPYTKEQQEKIITDFKRIYTITIANTKREEHPIYFATAGAPGVCYTDFLHQKFGIHTNEEIVLPENAVYLAPDDLYMPNMQFYQESLAASDRFAAYKDARDGSNWGTNVMHAVAVIKRRHIIHDATSSSPICNTIYKALEREGYQIQLALIFARDRFRADTLRNYIESHGPIVNEHEALKKFADVIARMQDTYFDIPTIVDFLWVERADPSQQLIFKKFAHYDKRNVPYLDDWHRPGETDQESEWDDLACNLSVTSLIKKPRMRNRNLEISRSNSNCYGYMIRVIREYEPPNEDASRNKAGVLNQLIQWIHTPNTTPSVTPTSSPRRGSPRRVDAGSPLVYYLNGLTVTTSMPELTLPAAATTMGAQKTEPETPLPLPGPTPV